MILQNLAHQEDGEENQEYLNLIREMMDHPGHRKKQSKHTPSSIVQS